MPTQDQVPRIIDELQKRLEEASKRRPVHLKVRAEESNLEDEWLYVCVAPTVDGERASDYANLMAEIEKGLRAEGSENVLLGPIVND